MYLIHTPSGETKMIPTPTSTLRTESSKYIIQYYSSMAVGGICISIHSASAWDLITVRGAKVMPCPINSRAHFTIVGTP